MTVKDRIKKFIEYKGYPVRKFETETGLSHGYINNIRVSIQPPKLKSIALRFPELDINWLMTGEGNMLKDSMSEAAFKYEKTEINNPNDFNKEYFIPNLTPEAAKSVLIRSVERMTLTAERNSHAQAQMAETADRDSKTLATLVNYLLNSENISINDINPPNDINQNDKN